MFIQLIISNFTPKLVIFFPTHIHWKATETASHSADIGHMCSYSK